MTFNKLLEDLESDFGRLNFRDRIMLRRAYDVMPEKEETERICHKVDKWDSEHRYYAYQNIGDISENIWHIDTSENGSYPKCNVIKWFKTEEDVKYYLRNMKSSIEHPCKEEFKNGDSTGDPFAGWVKTTEVFKTEEDVIHYLKDCVNKRGQ